MTLLSAPLGGLQPSVEVEAQRMRRKPIGGDVAPALASADQEREDGLTQLNDIYRGRLQELAKAFGPTSSAGMPAAPNRPSPYPQPMVAADYPRFRSGWSVPRA